MSANFCMNCGNALPENAKFCPNCGTPITSISKGTQPSGNFSSTDDAKSSQKSVSQQASLSSKRLETQGGKLDLFFYIPIGICAAMALINLLFIGELMRVGKGGAGLFFILLNLAMAAIIWKWPYQEYKRGNMQKSRKGVLVFAGIALVFVLISAVSSQIITALLDLVALGSLAYLFYKLGGDSWSF